MGALTKRIEAAAKAATDEAQTLGVPVLFYERGRNGYQAIDYKYFGGLRKGQRNTAGCGTEAQTINGLTDKMADIRQVAQDIEQDTETAKLWAQ